MPESNSTDIILDLAHLHLRDDGILQVKLLDHREMTVKDTQEIVKSEGILSKGKKVPKLYITKKLFLPNDAVRRFSASEEGL